jgi:heme iron utilization protein
MKNVPDLQKLESDYRALIDSQLSLLLATGSDNGDADISYAPYVCLENVFYVYVSELAKHTGNMLQRRQASVMFIQPEAEAANLFARQRLVFNCRVAEIGKDSPSYSRVLDAMRDRFGEVVGVLRSLPDFHLLALTPLQGQYVAGFGKAFGINVDSGALLPRGE